MLEPLLVDNSVEEVERRRDKPAGLLLEFAFAAATRAERMAISVAALKKKKRKRETETDGKTRETRFTSKERHGLNEHKYTRWVES